MGVLVRIETKVLDVLEWGYEYSPEQQDYNDSYIKTFESKMERYLVYSINGFYQVNLKFNFNPIDMKFKLVECSNYKHTVQMAIETELKNYF